jgi:hypothetical protein
LVDEAGKMLTRLDPNDPSPATASVPADWLEDPAFAAFGGVGNTRQWIDALVARGEPDEALRLMARLLPKPYALAWACECLRASLKKRPADDAVADRIGLGLAETCLKSPTDERRRHAIDFAERDEFKSAGAWLAAAAAWTNGNLAPEGASPVAPPEGLTGELVTAALLAASHHDPVGRTGELRDMVHRALNSFGAPAGPT